LKNGLKVIIPKALPQRKNGKGIKIYYSIYRRLARYHLDGRYKLDNNLIENSIRGMAIGRKNYLFCGNHDSAENAAIMYSLIETCKAQDVDPREWLTDVLEREYPDTIMIIALTWQTCFLTTGKSTAVSTCVRLIPKKVGIVWTKYNYFSKILIKIQPVSERFQNLLDIIGRV
jgi:hypothetical protein